MLAEKPKPFSTDRKLNATIRGFIVERLGAYVAERKVAEEVLFAHGVEITREAVHWYLLSPVWGPKIQKLRQDYRDKLELRNRLAAVEARVMELAQDAEAHRESSERYIGLWQEADAAARELESRLTKTLDANPKGAAWDPDDDEDEDDPVPGRVKLSWLREAAEVARAGADRLLEMAKEQEKGWHHALAEIRAEMAKSGIQMAFSDAESAADFIRKLAGTEPAKPEALPPVTVSDPNAEE